MRDPQLGYLDAVLAWVPRPCRRALDVGCGEGELARRIAPHAERVVAIDRSPETIALARAYGARRADVELVVGDFTTHPFPDESFDFVAAVASLHHVDLDLGLATLARLARPGGTVVVHGLARDRSPFDWARSAFALALRPFVRARARGDWRSELAVGPSRMPLAEPSTSYAEVRRAAERLLPGSRFERHLFFRYTLVWHKPLAGV